MTREKAIEILKRKTTIPNDGEDFDDISDAFDMAIEALSSSENPNKWIPVSKKLPEEGQRVIATVESIDGNYVRETICGKYGLLCGNGIAWMPLPEPYKAEGSEE